MNETTSVRTLRCPLGVALLVVAAPLLGGCDTSRLFECLGDGPTTYRSGRVTPERSSVVAGSGPLALRFEGELQCVGQGERLVWSRSPDVGQLAQDVPEGATATFTPPAAVSAPTTVTVSVRALNTKLPDGLTVTATIEVRPKPN